MGSPVGLAHLCEKNASLGNQRQSECQRSVEPCFVLGTEYPEGVSTFLIPSPSRLYAGYWYSICRECTDPSNETAIQTFDLKFNRHCFKGFSSSIVFEYVHRHSLTISLRA